MRKHLIAALLLGLAAGPLLAAPAARAEGAQCFYSQDWDGWKATADSKAIYIKADDGSLSRVLCCPGPDRFCRVATGAGGARTLASARRRS